MFDTAKAHEAERLVEKRRLQNRLAQKRRRERIKTATTDLCNNDALDSFDQSSQSTSSAGTSQLMISKKRHVAIDSDTEISRHSKDKYNGDELDAVVAFVKLADRMSKNVNQLTKDTLFQAVLYESSRRNRQLQSNRLPFPVSLSFEGQGFFMAIKNNSLCLGFSDSQLQDYEAISDIGQRWMTQSPSQNGRQTSWESVPDNMHPTALQIISEHHPFLDVSFPWPIVRDRLLEATKNGLIDEDELCCDLIIGGAGANSEPASFRIWGSDSMDPDSWELGEQFAQKYSYLFDSSIVSRSNWWRKQRGLSPIVIDCPRIVSL